MVLESTMICMDNTEYMRNGDFLPSRLNAEQDAISLICHAKSKQHVENTVGLLTMGQKVEVITTLTSDVQKVMTKAHGIQTRSSTLQFISAIRVACLVLKHRQNKNQRQRIVVFVGSPLRDEEGQLVALAKKLRKEKVTIDVVNFGEDAMNTDRLVAFVAALNGGATQSGASTQSGSHIVTIPGGNMLNESLLSSPIVVGEDGAASAGAAGSGGVATGFEFGVDPNEDPELALALRVSLEEQRARQLEEERRAQINATATPQQPTSTQASTQPSSQAASAQPTLTVQGAAPTHDELSEDEQLALAIQLSMANAGMETEAVGATQAEADDAEMEDAAALRSVLENLPGVDQTDPAARDAMNQLGGAGAKPKKDEQKK